MAAMPVSPQRALKALLRNVGVAASRVRQGPHLAALPLIPLFGLLLLAAIWLAFFIRHDAQRDSTLAAELRQVDSVAAAFSEYTLRELRDIDRTSLVIKAQFEHDGIVNLPYLMRNRLVPANGPVRISVTDSTGNVVASNLDFRSTVNLADREFFRRHAANDTGALDISQPFTGNLHGATSIRMSRRLNLGDGSFGGVVVLSVEPAYFADFYRESQLGPHGLIALVGTDGLYRMRRTGNEIEAAFDGSTTPLFTGAMANGEGAFIGPSVIDGTRRLLAYRKLLDYPLIVGVARAEDEVMTQFNQFWSVYRMVGVIASLLIFAFFATITVFAYRARRVALDVRRQQGFLQGLVDNMPLGVIARSMKPRDRGRIVVWNPGAEVIFGVPAANAVGKSMGEVLGPAYGLGVEESDSALLDSPMVQDWPQVVADVPIVGKRVLRVVRAPIFDVDDEVEYVLSIIQDVTNDEIRADALRLNARVFEATADAIVIGDGDDRVIAVNAAFTKLTGFEPADILGSTMPESPFRAADPGEYAILQQTLLRDGLVTAEVMRYRKDGSALPCWLTKTCVRDAEGKIVHYVHVFTDISELKAAQTKLEELANVDPLTGLPNRRLFHDRLEQAMRRAERAGSPVGLVFIDLDDFKKINDEHGHDAGDAVLKEVAYRLQRCVRASDSLCRLGGDEFTILMEDSTLPEDAHVVAERIAWAFDPPIDIGGKVVHCRASMGIALYPDHGHDAETLVKRADMAMYQAKHAGRQRCVMATATEPITVLDARSA